MKEQTSSQNVIAIIWDFDKTLIPDYMQTPLFKHYGVDEKKFWDENNSLVKLYKEKGVKVNPETIYLNHILTYVRNGVFADLSNDKLKELGNEITFFDGLPEFLDIAKKYIAENDKYKTFDIKLEHYIVSTGLTQMINGSKIAPFVDNAWGCEFLEEQYKPNQEGNLVAEELTPKIITGIAYTIDNTSKTKAIFEINKGVNKYDSISVNQKMSLESRRVPIENMIYIADGPSDVPAFSVVKKHGGAALAVYKMDSNMKSFKQAKALLEDGRVDYFSEANYTKDSATYMWLVTKITEIAERIYKNKMSAIESNSENVPTHLV